VLTFAQIGFRSKEAPVNGQSTVDMALEQAPTMLQEVVVTGYTTQRRGDITGAVSSVNLEPVVAKSSVSVLQRLDGAVPGVTVNNSGSPGSRSTVRVRGVSSFHDNDPLYIIDGTPVEDSYLNFLNANDIGQIQVLKDASSASIYGSRASNGVVIIETKKGRPGGRSMRLDVSTGAASPTRGYNDFIMTDPIQYFDVIKRAYHNAGLKIPGDVKSLYGDTLAPSIPAYTYIAPGVVIDSVDAFGRPVTVDEAAYSYPNTLIMPGSAGTDWWNAVFGSAQFTDANLSVSGGGSDNSYNVSFNYLKQNGTAAYNQFQRGGVRVNTAFTISKLTVGENVAVSREQGYGGLDDDQLGEDGIVGKNILMQAIVPVYDIAGNFASGKAAGLGNNTNPLKYAWARKDDRNTTDRAIGNAYGSFALLPDLAFKSQFSFNLTQGLQTAFTPTTFENAEANATNGTAQNDHRQTTWTWTNTFNYVRGLSGGHNMNLLLGQEANSTNGRLLSGGISGLLDDSPQNRYIDESLGDASTKTVSSSGFFDRLLSFFGKADYNYNQKYYASVTVRRDGSSKFATGKQWGTFPAFNVGWRLSRESFFPEGGFFSNVMLRAGYGITGNQNIPGGRIVAKVGGGTGDTFYDIGGTQTSIQPGFRQVALGNAALTWEEQKSGNVGLDLEFAGGRGNVTVDVYNRRTDNLLFDPRSPATAGQASSAIQNVGEMGNKGVDFSIAYSGTIGASKVWSVAFNGGHYTNKILRIDGQISQFPGPGGAQVTRIGNPIMNMVGGPIGAFYGKVANGYYATDADAIAHKPDSLGVCATPPCQPNAVVGGIRYADVNGDGTIDANDRTIIGSPHPDFTGGLDLGFRMGQWDFSATVFGSFGGQIYDAQKDFYVFRDFETNVVNDRLSNSFCIQGDEGCTHPGDQNAKYPRLNQNDLSSGDISSFFIESATYVRLRALQIGWTVPANLIHWLPSGRVYVQGENLLTLTGYSGLDPALPARAFTGASGDVRDQFRNVDVGVYPTSRILTVGISTSF
jgi:TonB-linked SusC/RagA family outer membrane protein